MKNLLCLILVLGLSVLILSGCGGAVETSDRTAAPTAGVSEVIESGIAAADAERDGQEENEERADVPEIPENREEQAPRPEAREYEEELSGGTERIDIDLTEMSSTMVYSEVYSMLETPENYIGKTVKMNGIFAYYYDEETGSYYFACIIRDATACCSQGIEFVLTDDYVYPDDYPEVGGDVTVLGRFDTYMEGEYLYCTLRDAVLI
ncbi:MAG: hypothetical protein IK082_04870 [Oscillospiraceae bacterium]|nr:hypothetical protein [Oscillospiraceae bacterium]